MYEKIIWKMQGGEWSESLPLTNVRRRRNERVPCPYNRALALIVSFFFVNQQRALICLAFP